MGLGPCQASCSLIKLTTLGVKGQGNGAANRFQHLVARLVENGRMLNCVDLFAGAGGFSLAAKEAGFEVRLAIENDSHAISTYKANFCDGEQTTKIQAGDISLMSPGEIFADVFNANEHCDLLLGGPPCQGFSTHRINNAGVEDARNELIHVYFDFVRTFAPSVFLMENVPGMLWARHEAYLNKFYEQAQEAGYFVFKPVVLDARDFGVPQRRKRVFLLGVKEGVSTEGLLWPPQPSHGSEAARQVNPDLKPWINCSDAFRPAPCGDPNDTHMTHSRELVEAFEKTPINGGSRFESGRLLECHKNHDGHKDVYGRINPMMPGPTMTTACINPSKGRFVHPVLNHGITVRNAARMQTFPDSFVFHGGLIAAGRQVGNAVPVQLGKILIEHLKSIILAASESSHKTSEAMKRRAA